MRYDRLPHGPPLSSPLTHIRPSPLADTAHPIPPPLFDIQDISTLLLSASLAIKSLTTPTSLLSQSDPPPDPTSIPPPTLPSQLETFKSHASTFHNLLDSIRVNLRRQILLQDQAEILAPLPSNSATGATAANAAGSTGPGAGGFDIGLLNVRNDAVGKDMEAELWEKTRAFLDSMERAREAADAERQLLGGATNEPVETADGDIDMAR